MGDRNPIRQPRYFTFLDQVWSVEEREPTKVELEPHQAVLLFRQGKRARWMPHTRAMLRFYSTRDLGEMLLQATPIEEKDRESE